MSAKRESLMDALTNRSSVTPRQKLRLLWGLSAKTGRSIRRYLKEPRTLGWSAVRSLELGTMQTAPEARLLCCSSLSPSVIGSAAVVAVGGNEHVLRGGPLEHTQSPTSSLSAYLPPSPTHRRRLPRHLTVLRVGLLLGRLCGETNLHPYASFYQAVSKPRAANQPLL